MECHAVCRETIVKLRVLSRNQQLLRMDFEERCARNDLFLRYAQQHLADADLVILSDYAKGTLQLVQSFIAHCRERGTRLWLIQKVATLSGIEVPLSLPRTYPSSRRWLVHAIRMQSWCRKQKRCAPASMLRRFWSRGQAGMTLVQSDSQAQRRTGWCRL